MYSDQFDLWQLEVDALPWGGRSPRAVVQRSVAERVSARAALLGTCVVDKSDVGCPSREANCIDVDPAQFQLCVSTSFMKEV